MSRFAEWMSPQELADLFGVPLATVYAWNYRGTGPTPHKMGKHVRYQKGEVDAWAASQAPGPKSAA